MKEEIIQQGAEANIIYTGEFVIKERVAKGYRLKELDDKIRKRRTKSEAKILTKAAETIGSPKPFYETRNSYTIKMPFVEGNKLSESLDDLRNWKEVCQTIGRNIAKLHDADIIHGDLTTSNMILREGEVIFIDFGLGFQNGRIEDKAVDLYLIKEALEAKHFKRFEEYFAAVLEGYKLSKSWKEVLKRLEKVEKRGRYKQQY
jgi:Kae1-associated kinase Bud32